MQKSSPVVQSTTQAIVQEMAKDTKVSAPVLKGVDVRVNTDLIVVADARSYFYELRRLNPDTFDAIEINDGGERRPLTEDDLIDYFRAIIKIRVDSTTPQGSKDWKLAKQLRLPAKLELAISALGVVTIREIGVKLKPVYDYEYNMDKLLEISEALGAFEADGLYLFKDCFPRSMDGNLELMSFICRDGLVFGKNKELPPAMAYVAGYLGLEMTDKAYDCQYLVPFESVDYIKEAFRAERRLICSI